MQDEREKFAPFMYIQHPSIPLTTKHGSNSPKFVKQNSKSDYHAKIAALHQCICCYSTTNSSKKTNNNENKKYFLVAIP